MSIRDGHTFPCLEEFFKSISNNQLRDVKIPNYYSVKSNVRNVKKKNQETILALHDEYKRWNRNSIRKIRKELKINYYKPIVESLSDLLKYLDAPLRNSKIDTLKKEYIDKYQYIIDNKYGNIYKMATRIENVENLECTRDLEIYNKLQQLQYERTSTNDNVHRTDCFLQVLQYHRCMFNEPINIYTSSQLYNYLKLSIQFGNIYENVKYVNIMNETLQKNYPHRVVHYFLVRECNKLYLQHQKNKIFKIKILFSYLKSLQRKYGNNPEEYIQEYFQYIMECTQHFVQYGHLRHINRYYKIIPKIIRHILTKNNKFKNHNNSPHHSVDFRRLFSNITLLEEENEDAQLQSNSNIFTESDISPMQIHKFIETNNEMYISNIETLFEENFWSLERDNTIDISKMYDYLIYKYGYLNNDLLLVKYRESLDQFKHYIQDKISSTLLSTRLKLFTTQFPYLPHLFQSIPSLQTIHTIQMDTTTTPTHYMAQLDLIKQFILSSLITNRSTQ